GQDRLLPPARPPARRARRRQLRRGTRGRRRRSGVDALRLQAALERSAAAQRDPRHGARARSARADRGGLGPPARRRMEERVEARMSAAAFSFVFVTVLLDMVAIGIIIPVLPGLVVAVRGGDTASAGAAPSLVGP